MKLDKALDKLSKPRYEGQIIPGLPCDLCDKSHTRVKAVKIDNFLIWEIHSPCLDKLIELAVGTLNKRLRT